MPLTKEPPHSVAVIAAGFCCFELDNLEQVAIAAGDETAGQILASAFDVLVQIFGVESVIRRPDSHGFYVTLRGEVPAPLSDTRARGRALDDREEALKTKALGQIDRALDAMCVGRAEVGEISWPVTARAGIAWAADAQSDSAAATDPAELRRRALAASAAAKYNRVGRCVHGSASAAMERRAQLVCGLLASMAEDRVKIFAQEIVSLASATPHLRQYEILIQITDSAGVDHPPSEFVALAEESALIEILDRWIIRKTLLGHAEALRARPEISLSLNLSGRSLGLPGTWSFLQETITASGIAPERIQLEITETSSIGDMAQAAANVRAARAAGLDVALDDFGAGLSGYGYLTSFDVNCIKIDGALIPNVVDEGSIETEILSSIMALAKRLDLMVVAEHVSSPQILAALTRLGVTKVQGYEVGKPRPLVEILN